MTKRVYDSDKFSFQFPVEDKDLSAPPSAPTKGDRYIVGSSGSGAWASQDSNIAEWSGSAWFFISKKEGMIVYVKDEDSFYYYVSSWTILSLGETSDYYLQEFDVDDLSGGILNITHNLNSKYCSVAVYNNSDKLIQPDETTASTNNNLTIDIHSYGSITGTWRALVLAKVSSSARVSFTNANLSSGILTVNHNLGQKYAIVQVFDNNDKQILPDYITLVTSNQCTIDLTSFGTISGTWSVVVLV
jgi:hypothetical protein